MRAATHDPYPPAEEYLAASGGIFRDLHIHDFDAIRFVSGDEIVEVYADGSALETPWLEQYGDVDVAAAVLRLAGGGLVILSGTRHDPLGYDVRLEVFGTKDSLVPGSTSARRSPDARAPPIETSGTASSRPTAPSSRPSSRAFGPEGKALVLWRKHAPHSAPPWPPIAPWPSTGRWHWQRHPRTVENRKGQPRERRVMDNDLIEEELTQVTRRGLLLKGGAAAAGLSVLGVPSRAFAASEATIKVAVVTHGDTGSFWSVFKKGVDQAKNDLKGRGVSVTQVYANNDVRSRSPGSTPQSQRGQR